MKTALSSSNFPVIFLEFWKQKVVLLPYQNIFHAFHTPSVLWCDNVSALALASNPVYHGRTKHIEVDYHIIREKGLNHDILVKFISSGDQVANIFTEGLSSSQFLFLKAKLMFVPPISLQGLLKSESYQVLWFNIQLKIGQQIHFKDKT
jgi:hypothetical protein